MSRRTLAAALIALTVTSLTGATAAHAYGVAPDETRTTHRYPYPWFPWLPHPAVPTPAVEDAPAAHTDPLAGAVANYASTAPNITFTPCKELQCATLTVPVDYRKPTGPTTTLALTRRPADLESRRRGVLFVNPGGPGASAAKSVQSFARIVGRQVRARFDIVGLDPRGVVLDQPRCTTSGYFPHPLDMVMFPTTDSQANAVGKLDAAVAAACRHQPPKLLRHMSTADVVRDHEVLRHALGEKHVWFYGTSYGTHVGMTYRTLYPSSIAALVMDGPVDSVAWTTGRGNGTSVPQDLRLGSGDSAVEALEAALARCELSPSTHCPHRRTIRADIYTLLDDLKRSPMLLPDAKDPGLITLLTYDVVLDRLHRSLYNGRLMPSLFDAMHTMRRDAQHLPGPDDPDPVPDPTAGPLPTDQPAPTAPLPSPTPSDPDPSHTTAPGPSTTRAPTTSAPKPSVTSSPTRTTERSALSGRSRRGTSAGDGPSASDALAALDRQLQADAIQPGAPLGALTPLATVRTHQLDSVRDQTRAQRTYNDGVRVTPQAVACSDAVNPTDPSVWYAGAKKSFQLDDFNQIWLWQNSICGIPDVFGSDTAYQGGFASTAGPPILLLATTHDPATPWEGARQVRADHARSRLVSVQWWGHGVLDISGCASAIRSDFLLTGALPPVDLTCAVDATLFPRQ